MSAFTEGLIAVEPTCAASYLQRRNYLKRLSVNKHYEYFPVQFITTFVFFVTDNAVVADDVATTPSRQRQQQETTFQMLSSTLLGHPH